MADDPGRARDFGPAEKDRIRELLRDPVAALTCPRCGSALTLGAPMVGGTQGDYWEIACAGCGGRMIAGARHVPPGRQPEG